MLDEQREKSQRNEKIVRVEGFESLDWMNSPNAHHIKGLKTRQLKIAPGSLKILIIKRRYNVTNEK